MPKMVEITVLIQYNAHKTKLHKLPFVTDRDFLVEGCDKILACIQGYLPFCVNFIDFEFD